MARILPLIERALPALAIVYMIGFAIIGPPFAKLGIPLSFSAPQSALTPRLFLTEIFILVLIAAAAANMLPSPLAALRKARVTPLLILIGLFFTLIASRIAMEIRYLPSMVIRNSAFGWYMIFPLLFLLNSVKAEKLEQAVRAALLLIFAYSCAKAFAALFFNEITFLQKSWVPEYGPGFIVFFSLITRQVLAWAACLTFLGTAIGFALTDKLQRTSLVNLAAALVIILFSLRKMAIPRERLLRLFLIPIAMAVGLALMSARPLLADALSGLSGFWKLDENPLYKAETGSMGIEGFRESMWLDAIQLGRSHLWSGVGLREQVVTRVYAGGGRYVPNRGGFESPQSAPIAGPHNSYLNAFARLGLPAAILLATIHLAALIILYSNGYWASFFCMLGQIIYACFNVGLEGPVRSFGLLVCLSIALKLARNEPSQTA